MGRLLHEGKEIAIGLVIGFVVVFGAGHLLSHLTGITIDAGWLWGL